ncbi:FHA domain-containing protein [Eubacterium sp. 1001713B170207_170306_E7]|uniref:FHA domain-containing protein n=1 Tax=Eubacterium sp. 1001713B170207_170306_E7 TaxID=2787097 RepID=UPI001898292F|nr:FHA domain-containing protein [Eubacterium sp. 1001713B170207_170306_E7]
MKITIEDKSFNVLCPPIFVPDISNHNDHAVVPEAHSSKRAPVDLPGAPDLRSFKEEEETILNETYSSESEKTPEVKEKPEKHPIFSLFRRKKKRKKEELTEEIEFQPLDFKTIILDDDIPYLTLKSRQSNVSDLVIFTDYYPIGRRITDLQAFSYISKCHGLIYCTDRDHAYFGDCSQNTNRINGQPLSHMKYYELKEGDSLRLGQLEFIVEREKYDF